GGGHVGGGQIPGHERPVAVAAAVDAVVHVAVEVRHVLPRPGAELHHVEVRVAADQRIERPRNLGDAPPQRPGALVRLDGEADAAPRRGRQDAGDVTVHGRVRRRTEETDARADEVIAIDRADHVVLRLRHRPQQFRRDRRVPRVRPPDLVDEPPYAGQTGDVDDLAYDDAGRARRRLGRR